MNNTNIKEVEKKERTRREGIETQRNNKKILIIKGENRTINRKKKQKKEK